VAVDARRNPEVVPGKNIYEMEDGSKAWFELVIYGGRKLWASTPSNGAAR